MLALDLLPHHLPLIILDPDVDGPSLRVQEPHQGLEQNPLLLGLFDGQVVVLELYEHAFQRHLVPLFEVGVAAQTQSVLHYII